jgi:hypothetical protein
MFFGSRERLTSTAKGRAHHPTSVSENASFGLQQLAAAGLILIMLGALQKKIFSWKIGFWGKTSLGWYSELTLVSMLLVILLTDGGRFVLTR